LDQVVQNISHQIYRSYISKTKLKAFNNESHLSFEKVHDLLLRIRVRSHGTPGCQRRHHLIHRLSMHDGPARDAGTNFNCWIFSFHLQDLTVAAAVYSRKLSECQPDNKKLLVRMLLLRFSNL